MPPVLLKASESYQIRSMKLYMIMTKLLQDVHCQRILDQVVSTVTPNDGVSLLTEARDAILPRTTLQILELIVDLGNYQHENGKTVETLGVQVEHIFARLDSLKCTSINDLKLAVCQHAFLHGAYSKHESLNYMQQKLKNNKKK